MFLWYPGGSEVRHEDDEMNNGLGVCIDRTQHILVDDVQYLHPLTTSVFGLLVCVRVRGIFRHVHFPHQSLAFMNA